MKEFIKDILVAFAIVVLLSLVIKPTIVKESSMEDTLYENNYLILNKLSYISKDHPEYGDIIVFESDIYNDEAGALSRFFNKVTGGSENKLLIKRVIGVEGDVITIADGDVYRNGEKLTEEYIKCDFDEGTLGSVNNYKVPENKIFVMGDHRTVSSDSRSPEVGAVDEDRIVGKAVLRLYPFNEIRTF